MDFLEDDEMELEDQLDGAKREAEYAGNRVRDIRRQIKKKQLDPTTAKIAELAFLAGEGQGNNRASRERIRFLERRIKVRDERLEELEDRDEWKSRALEAEAALDRIKKRKRRK